VHFQALTGKVLDSRGHFNVARIVALLHAAQEFDSVRAREKRVFCSELPDTPVARISWLIDIRSKTVETDIRGAAVGTMPR